MKLGAFSISLSVKDLIKSKEFYQSLGFSVFAGSEEHKYLILKNEETLIGIFEGMFEGNMMTFNPGWDQSAKNLEEFDDIREIQSQLKSQGIAIDKEVAADSISGPAHMVIRDPDGNVIFIDQHR